MAGEGYTGWQCAVCGGIREIGKPCPLCDLAGENSPLVEVAVEPTAADILVVQEETIPPDPAPSSPVARALLEAGVPCVVRDVAIVPPPPNVATRRGDGHACDWREIPQLGVLPCGLCTRRACALCGCEKWECPHERDMRIRLVTIEVTEVQGVELSPLARILAVVPMDFGGLGAAALVVLAPEEGIEETRTIRMLQIAGADRLPNPARQRYVGQVRIVSESGAVFAFLHVFEELKEESAAGLASSRPQG